MVKYENTECLFFFLSSQEFQNIFWAFEGEKEEKLVKGQRSKEKEKEENERAAATFLASNSEFQCAKCASKYRSYGK